MDGDGMAPAEALIQDRTLHDRGAVGRATTRRPKTVRWLVIIGLLLAVVLGGLYGFNRFREHAIATFLPAKAAAGADQRGRGQDRGGAALRPGDRLDCRGSPSHDQS